MKRVLNKWQLELKFHRDCMYVQPNLYILFIGFYKFISFPREGYCITKKNYKGFRLIFRIVSPITILKNYN